jgi:hypothetical protein
MISISIIIFILIIHFLADFCLQTNDQALLKSKDLKHLQRHVLNYSLVWFLASYCLLGSWLLALSFACATYSAHILTDYITSRIGKPFWESKDYHTGFVVVGADQVAHYLQLIYTYKILSEL